MAKPSRCGRGRSTFRWDWAGAGRSPGAPSLSVLGFPPPPPAWLPISYPTSPQPQLRQFPPQKPEKNKKNARTFRRPRGSIACPPRSPFQIEGVKARLKCKDFNETVGLQSGVCKPPSENHIEKLQENSPLHQLLNPPFLNTISTISMISIYDTTVH